MSYTASSRDHERSLMQALCRYIEANSEKNLTLPQLAKQAQLSPDYLQRRFKAQVGVSPKEYLEACRLKKLKRSLRQDASVSGAIYEAGFGSSSRVYERADTRLGMTPKQYRAKGRHLEISYACGATPLGKVMIAATDRGVCFLQFGERESNLRAALQTEYEAATLTRAADSEQLGAWMSALNDYLADARQHFSLPLDIRGTAFQMKVWKYLQTIPPGTTQSYTEVARAIGKPSAVRAVASACAKNNVAIVIPCHRVLRSDGTLAGYRWGIDRKKKLLATENQGCANI